MTVYADLGPIDYFREFDCSSWCAVGWLGEGHPYSQGEVSPEVVERLARLLRGPWQPVVFFGFHQCDLCGFEKASTRTEDRGKKPVRIGPIGNCNLWVPGRRRVYVTPWHVSHYIWKHGYRPPEEFIEAVLRCPDTHVEAYRDALQAVDPGLAALWTPG